MLIDSSIMLGKVNDFLARARVKSRSSMAAISGIPSTSWNFLALLRSDPLIRMNFDRLNVALALGISQCNSRLDLHWHERPPISSKFKYIINLRPSLNTSDGFNYGPKLDTDLFVAHLIHYAYASSDVLLFKSLPVQSPRTVILLNFPPSTYNGTEEQHSASSFTTPPSFSDDSSTEDVLDLLSAMYPATTERPQPTSTSAISISGVPQGVNQQGCDVEPRIRCLDAAKAISNSLALIRAIDFDISVLHPFAAVSFYDDLSR
jgi:hypothetical protein